MTRPRLLALLGTLVLCRLAAPVDAVADTGGAQAGGVRIGAQHAGDGTAKPSAHMTRNLRATRSAERKANAATETRPKARPRQ
jgi:hypothetical protein